MEYLQNMTVGSRVIALSYVIRLDDNNVTDKNTSHIQVYIHPRLIIMMIKIG